MLNALIWNYKGSDLSYLADYQVLEVVHKGNGERMHPITQAWGKQIKQCMQSDDVTLTRTIANLFEFLFKQILSQVIILDAQSKDDMNPSEASRT